MSRENRPGWPDQERPPIVFASLVHPSTGHLVRRPSAPTSFPSRSRPQLVRNLSLICGPGSWNEAWKKRHKLGAREKVACPARLALRGRTREVLNSGSVDSRSVRVSAFQCIHSVSSTVYNKL